MKIHRFQTKLLILFISLIAVVQIATFTAVLATTKRSIGEDAREELRLGGRMFHRLLHSRNEQLAGKAHILTSDFAFREVVLTGDSATIQSAFANYGARIEADIAMLASLDGELIASTHHSVERPVEFPFPHLMHDAEQQVNASSMLIFRGEPYQFVLVPVYAPVQTGWVCVGFRVGDELAEEFKSLTALDISFVAKAAGEEAELLATTLGINGTWALSNALADVFSAARGDPEVLGNTDQLTLPITLAGQGGYEVLAVVQTSMARQLAPYYRIQWQLVALSVVALILSVVAASLLAGSVTRPVQALVSAARDIESGRYARAVQIDRTDEIGMLATTFNSIVHRAHHDALTGLPNRAVVGDRLTMALARAQRQGTSFALLMMDVNRFKEINDTLGHQTGDLVLQETARRLANNSRDTDTVARLGGDEFLVLLEDVDQRQALDVAHKLIRALTSPIALPQMQISVKMSVGVALYPAHAHTVEILLRRADVAMYHAKETRTPIAVYKMGQDEKHLLQITLINDLARAVDTDELFLHYQPKIELGSGRAQHVEALVRWQHPRYGVVPPDDFISLAEESGQIRALTRWVLKGAIQQCQLWRERGMDLSVSVNLSALDLLDEALPDTITQALSAHDVAPACLTLEITEGAVMRDAGHALRVLNQLKDIGIRLAIDDFGTGYSSLTQLKRLPVDEIKIDKSFIMHLEENDEDAVIVRSTVDLGHNMGLVVTAEGVETEACRSLLASYGCDMVQGYLISRALSVQEIARWKKSYDKRQRPVLAALPRGHE